MSINRFSYSPPADLRGLEDYAPEELRGLINELVRRDEQRFTGLVNAIRNQVIVDTDLLPTQTSGASEESDTSVSSSEDTEDAEIFAVLWEA